MQFTHLAATLLVVQVAGCFAHHKPVDFVARNLKTISSIYNLTIYPNNVPIVAAGGNGEAAVPAGLLAANASGRISPLGNFTGFQDSIEYFFGLAFQPYAPFYPVFSKAEIVEYTSGCAEVASSVAYLTASVYNPGAPNDGQFITKLKQIAFWRFDDTGAVLYYDAWIPNLQRFQNVVYETNFLDPAAQNASIYQLCPVIQDRCTGNNTVYNSVDDCISFLKSIDFGNYDEVWGNNVACRQIHTILTLIRPEVHCPHVSPTGAMKCVDIPYNSYYFDDDYLFGFPVGQTFSCPNKTMHVPEGWKPDHD